MNICSVVPLPFQNPVCSFLRHLSTPLLILSMMTRLRTLLMIESSVIPPQFLHCLRFPFLGSFIIRPCFHFVGILSSFHILSISCFTLSVASSMSALRSSAVIESVPDAFLFFNCLVAFLISILLGFLISISSISMCSSFTSSSLMGWLGSSLIQISLKCSLHLCRVSSFPLIKFPFWSSTAILCFGGLLHTTFVSL